MKIYHYHPAAHIYIGQGLADPDPMVEGNWLIPAGATDKEPLPQQENKLVVFDPATGEWAYQDMPVVADPAAE